MVEPQPDELEPVTPQIPSLPSGEDGPRVAEAESSGVARQAVRIGALHLLFDFASTSQLSELVPISPLPATPHWMRGLASLHGMVLPVFDLAALLDLEAARNTKPLLLVVGHGDLAAAILIDGLPDRYRFDESERVEAWDAHPWLSDCVLAAFAREGRVWLDIDYRRLLDRIEQSLRNPRAETSETEGS